MSDFLFDDVQLDGTIKSIDITRAAIKRIHTVVTSEDYAGREADDIERFLLGEMKIIPFGLYLKRYLYIKAEIPDQFRKVGDEVYMQIIMDSFAMNRAPHSFEPTTVRWRKIVERWLTQDSVQRSTVLLLGFGLGMSAADVSEFLTKVISEGDFDFNDPWEVICWYCFRNGLSYADAVEYQEKYESIAEHFQGNGPLEALQASPTEENLMAWLSWLKQADERTSRKVVRMAVFKQLYQDCQRAIAQSYQDSEWAEGSGKTWNENDITSADIEKFLCDGIPKTKSGNLQKAADSALNRQFKNKRITRQRLDLLLKGELEVTRFDIISLQFLISAQNEDDTPTDRCRYFTDDVNDLLEQCGMMKLYPVNPYEAFVLMCLLKEDESPMEAYYEVWEKSYDKE